MQTPICHILGFVVLLLTVFAHTVQSCRFLSPIEILSGVHFKKSDSVVVLWSFLLILFTCMILLVVEIHNFRIISHLITYQYFKFVLSHSVSKTE